MSIFKIFKDLCWAIPSIVSFLNQNVQIPSAFPHEPYFLDLWSFPFLSSDSPAVPHHPLIKVPETGCYTPAESSPVFVWNRAERIRQYSCLFTVMIEEYFCVHYSAVCSLIISSDMQFHPEIKKGAKPFCSSLPDKEVVLSLFQQR